MFQWQHEYFLEVNSSVQRVWDYCLDPTNWLKWNEKFESCHYDNALKEGSIIKIKIKSRVPDVYIAAHIKVLQPYECKIAFKIPFCNQDNHCIFQEISTTKTRISVVTSIKSLLTPFLKSYFYKKLEQAKTSNFKRFLEVIEKDLMPTPEQ
jgi:hypothetical protein